MEIQLDLTMRVEDLWIERTPEVKKENESGRLTGSCQEKRCRRQWSISFCARMATITRV